MEPAGRIVAADVRDGFESAGARPGDHGDGRGRGRGRAQRRTSADRAGLASYEVPIEGAVRLLSITIHRTSLDAPDEATFEFSSIAADAGAAVVERVGAAHVARERRLRRARGFRRPVRDGLGSLRRDRRDRAALRPLARPRVTRHLFRRWPRLPRDPRRAGDRARSGRGRDPVPVDASQSAVHRHVRRRPPRARGGGARAGAGPERGLGRGRAEPGAGAPIRRASSPGTWRGRHRSRGSSRSSPRASPSG